MRQRLVILIGCLLTMLSMAAQTEDYSPENPPEPQLRMELTASTQPAGAGYAYGSGTYTEGAYVNVRTLPNKGYVFSHWLLNGHRTDYAQNFIYTMGDSTACFVAVYNFIFAPDSPAEPKQTDPTYRLTLLADPEGSCTFSLPTEQWHKANEKIQLDITPQEDYRLVGWYDAEGRLIGTSPSLTYAMPPAHTTLTARTMYAPAAPSEPQGNQGNVDSDKNSVVVAAWNCTRLYGDENPDFHFSYQGEPLVGMPEIVCEATPTSPAGIYPIVVKQGTIKNEKVSYVNGYLTIGKAPLTIAADTYTMRLGEPLPELELSYTGFKNQETKEVLTRQPTVVVGQASQHAADPATTAGQYPVMVFGAEARNYIIGYVNGTLIVADTCSVIVRAKSYTREYGEDNPTFGFIAEDAAIDGTPEIVCEATPTTPVGTYDIEVRRGTMSNDNIVYVNGTLTITKARLTATAQNCTREWGQDNPTFSIAYSGWKNDEDETVLLTEPVATTDATSESPAGFYPITVSGGEAHNYTFEYVDGMLAVTIPAGISERRANGTTRRIFTLSGQRLSDTCKTLPRGIYIVGGRKMVGSCPRLTTWE